MSAVTHTAIEEAMFAVETACEGFYGACCTGWLAAFVALDCLPLTSNGKLDRRALPTPDHSGLVTGRPPRNWREEQLCEVFASLLRIPSVGIDDNFFEMGGHSMLATRLANGVETALGLRLSVRTVFEAPTVAGLAARLDGAERVQRPALRRRGGAVRAAGCVDGGGS